MQTSNLKRDRPIKWIAPLLALVSAFYLYPAFEVLRFSFTDASLLGDEYSYTLDSYLDVLGNDDLRHVLRITVMFVLASIVLQIICGLTIAMAVSRAVRFGLPGASFMRTVVLSAWVMPGVIVGVIWGVVLNDSNQGLGNLLLEPLGVGPVSWLSDPNNALYSVIAANVWRGTAFSMILLYAGLQGVDETLYEAASVDGANAVRTFWHITLPQLRGVLGINIILITIYTLNSFDMILALTGGGPGRATEVLSLRTYNVIFQDFSLSKGAVHALLMMTIALTMTAIYTRVLKKQGEL